MTLSRRGRQATVTQGNGATTSSFEAVLDASWEIDLWGRVRRLNEAARAQFFASDEARRDVTALLVSDVAQAYFQLLALDEELRIAEESTNSFGQSLKIFSERYRGGVASKLEVSSAEALMASAATSALDLQRRARRRTRPPCTRRCRGRT